MTDQSLKTDDPRVLRFIDGALGVQRPIVLAHVRSIRRRHPTASPADVIRILENNYMAAVTVGGAAVGASAAIPGIGITASLALSGAETAGFLEISGLFAQSVTEVHGIAVDDPERARALVMTMILGSGGTELVRQLAAQVTGEVPARTAHWGELVTKTLPSAAMGPITDRIKSMFLRRFARAQSGRVLGRVIPFGIGAVVGGAGNHALGRKVVANARTAFGPAPASFPPGLEPVVRVDLPDSFAKGGKGGGGLVGKLLRRRRGRKSDSLVHQTEGFVAPQDLAAAGYEAETSADRGIGGSRME
jgi:hypothetical protein